MSAVYSNQSDLADVLFKYEHGDKTSLWKKTTFDFAFVCFFLQHKMDQ